MQWQQDNYTLKEPGKFMEIVRPNPYHAAHSSG
jgi:hypothetical protein